MVKEMLVGTGSVIDKRSLQFEEYLYMKAVMSVDRAPAEFLTHAVCPLVVEVGVTNPHYVIIMIMRTLSHIFRSCKRYPYSMVME